MDFPRTALLDALDRVGPRLEALEDEAEAAAAPMKEAIEILHDVGVMGLKSPRAVGGLEADWTLQIELLERIAWYSLSAAWCLMLYIDNTGRALSSLSDAGVARLLSGGRIPAVCGGGGLRMGKLTPAPGGWRLSGNWIFGSGFAQSDYVNMSALTPEGVMRQCIVPIADVISADNWQVMGLKGTGSVDFSVDDAFLPSELSFVTSDPPLRGGPLYRLGVFGYTGLCMPAVMIGAARRALHDLATTAASKSRGYMKKTTLADRGVFRSFVGESDLKLRAARLLAIDNGERLLREVDLSPTHKEAIEAETRAIGVLCSQTTIDVANGIIAYAGGEGVRAGKRFERTLRDLHMAGTHMYVSDIGYENHAEFVMGLTDAKLSA